MKASPKSILAVPTNIVTGFLGVGKTSAILHLLKNKPANERWAVLVNEFGEIGIDGRLIGGQLTNNQGVFISEVPGGCMCCAAGVPMQVALNQLLKHAKPDRLLIEPTGLGHPKEILQVLSASHYQKILSLQKTVTLVDARNLSDSRYTEHDIFNQQIAIADIIVGNKVDLYNDKDKQQLTSYIKTHTQGHTEVVFSQRGEIPLELLAGTTFKNKVTPHSHHFHQHKTAKPLASNMPIPDCGFIKAVNQGEGFCSIGWRFSSDIVFNYAKLTLLLSTLKAERIKAVFITDTGIVGYNITADTLKEITLETCSESRIEIIATELDDELDAAIMACIAQ